MGIKIEKTFEVELPDGSKWGVTATATKSQYVYGEDADGNVGRITRRFPWFFNAPGLQRKASGW